MRRRGSRVGLDWQIVGENRPRAQGNALSMDIDIVVVSEANRREDPMVRNRRRDDQQDQVSHAWFAHGWPKDKKPQRVRLTRLSPRAFDSDNNVSAFKWVRDQIADECDFNDGDRSVAWEYGWERHPSKRIRIEVWW